MIWASIISWFYIWHLIIILLSLIVWDTWANNWVLVLIIIHGLSTCKCYWLSGSLSTKLYSYSWLFLKLKHSLSLLVFLLFPIFLLDLFLQCISYSLLRILLLLHQDRFLISSLKNCSPLLQFYIDSSFSYFPSSHYLRKVHLSLHSVVLHTILTFQLALAWIKSWWRLLEIASFIYLMKLLWQILIWIHKWILTLSQFISETSWEVAFLNRCSLLPREKARLICLSWFSIWWDVLLLPIDRASSSSTIFRGESSL